MRLYSYDFTGMFKILRLVKSGKLLNNAVVGLFKILGSADISAYWLFFFFKELTE